MPGDSEAIAKRLAAAAARTVAAGTARVYSGFCEDSPVPKAGDRRGEGATDLAGRRTHIWEVPFSERGAAEISDMVGDDDAVRRERSEPQEMIYDGANTLLHVAGRWTGFFLGDREDPRGINDPLWPLDALFGPRDDAEQIAPETVRGVLTTRYRLTIDLALADAAAPSGVSVPSGPYRALLRMPTEVWLDEAGLARRISVCTETRPIDSDKPTWSVCELWDFGIAVDITPPGADEIVEPREVSWDAPEGS